MYILLDRTVGGDPVGAEGGMRSCGVLSDGFEIPKCTSHLGIGLVTIDDHPTITRFIDMVLEAPVNQNGRDRRGPRYFLRFRLGDGTSVVRVFRPETGEISRGIMTDPDAATTVADALQNRYQSRGGLLTTEEAKAEGLAQARIAGLVGEPTSTFAQLTTREQYVFTSSKGTGQCCSPASPLSGDADQEVWVVAFRGKVKLTLPSSGGKTYDNITFALDARTGEVIGVDAYPAGETIPYK